MKSCCLALVVCLNLCFMIAVLPAQARDAVPTRHQSDAQPLADPTRPVTEIARTGFTLQYFTREPCETRVEVREGDVPRTAWVPADAPKSPSLPVTIHSGAAGTRTYHVVAITGLKPGRRYFYRIYDPGVKPTAREAAWGAQPPWRRGEERRAAAAPRRPTRTSPPGDGGVVAHVVHVGGAGGGGRGSAPPPGKI